MSEVKVSVIVPVYNAAPYIEKCARSLFGQTLKEIEYIFIDDCSTDDSIEILKSVMTDYQDRMDHVRIIHNEKKLYTASRNVGFDLACGEYIICCDSDDWVDTDMYKRLYAEAKEKDADICFCDYNLVYADRTVPASSVEFSEDKVILLQNYIANGMNALWLMLVKRRLYEENGLRCPENIVYCEDFWLTVRLIYFAQRISKVNSALYYYNRINASSLLNTYMFNERVWHDWYFCYLDTIEFFKRHGDDNYEREMSWRVLRIKQDMVLDPGRYDEFLKIYPASHKYILSCPVRYCNRKIKLMMWLLAHRMAFAVTGINKLRHLLGR